MIPHLGEVSAVERDYPGEVGVVIEQGGKFGADEPANLGVGEAASEGRESGQGLDYVAQRAGLDNEDILEFILHSVVIIKDSAG
jgi:hypothetical protein